MPKNHLGKVKGRIKVTPWRCTPPPPNQCPYQISTSYTLQLPRYSTDKILKVKVTTARSKIKSRTHHDVAHLHPQLMSLPSINFLHLTVSEIWPGQDFQTQGHSGEVQGQIPITPWCCTLTPPNQCPYQVWNSYTLRFLRYRPDKLIPATRPSGHHGWK